MSSSRAGFSMIELIVVIAVIAAIATVIVPSVSGVNEAAERQRAIATAESVNLAIVRWRLAATDLSAWSTNPWGCVQGYLDFNSASSLSDLNGQFRNHDFIFGDSYTEKVILVPEGGTRDQSIPY